MLNEERVILMTRMASYEKGEGKRNVKIGNYFRSDYVTIHVLKAIVCGTIAFFIVFGLYILYNLEDFLRDLYKIDLLAFAKDILTYFCITVGAYTALTYVICSWQHAKARNSLKVYYHNLKKLNSLYNETQ